MKRTIFITGVSGCGKTSVGKSLSKKLGFQFFDGDDFHPKENIEKMSLGFSLNDGDRYPWLRTLNQLAKKNSKGTVIACSALKGSYRNILCQELDAQIIFLSGGYNLIYQRLKARDDHFMPSRLLQSQFDILELPIDAIDVDINQSIEKIVEYIISQLNMSKSNFGIIGLGVMGGNLARNIARNGHRISLYNRRLKGLEEDIAKNLTENFRELNDAPAFEDVAQFVESILRPRKILIMVKSGTAVDQVIEQILPLLDTDDILIDGGNSHFQDTQRRADDLIKHNIHFVGMGVSGGEEGALNGPAIMVGCTPSNYILLSPILESIAAKNKYGVKCCQRIGAGGSGHFVKMIHNGIEYAEMQLLAECYDILKVKFQYDNNQIAQTFSDWQAEEALSSYLLEITAKIFTKKENGTYVIDQILDQASNKGTGAWASIEGVKLGIPFNIISSALYARYTSSLKNKRLENSKLYNSEIRSKNIQILDIKDAYQVARILNHIQGFEYMAAASTKYDWGLDLGAIAQVWTGGCIIRSDLMHRFHTDVSIESNLFCSENWKNEINSKQASLKKTCTIGINADLPIPTFTACLNYFNAMKQAKSSANVIQAQRDFFGAHTFKRLSDPNGQSHHINWESI